MDAKQIMAGLNQFTGTETWWKHPLLTKYTYTDGVKYVADSCKAYWLIDAILAWQSNKSVQKQEFQVWKLTEQNDGSWRLICEDGDNHVVAIQAIPFSDFPLNEIVIWLTDNVLLLPSEY